MEKITYTPDNLTIFPGFYESELYYSDQEHNFSCNEGEEYEIKDFDGYCRFVCEALSDKISDYLTENELVCKSAKYSGMTSPREYNFSTDHLIMDLEIDLSKIIEIIEENEPLYNGFDKYLNKKYSSRSGFISFVSNNIRDFLAEDLEKYYDVLIDYWLLTKIYGDADVAKCMMEFRETPYWWDMTEIVSDAECQFMERVNS